MQRLKYFLVKAPVLCKANYAEGNPIYVKLETSLTGIAWVINKEGEDGVNMRSDLVPRMGSPAKRVCSSGTTTLGNSICNEGT